MGPGSSGLTRTVYWFGTGISVQARDARTTVRWHDIPRYVVCGRARSVSDPRANPYPVRVTRRYRRLMLLTVTASVQI
jgi:hypothetical protein